MTGIITAMKCEAEYIISQMENTQVRKTGPWTFTTGRLGSTETVLAVCGVGKVFAGSCAQVMITDFGCTHIYNIGAAGALIPGIEIGDIVCASACVEYDMDTSAVGDPVGMISGINMIELPCDENEARSFESYLAACGKKVSTGIIATGDRFFKGSDERNAVSARFGACAGEMEGAAIGQICCANSLPYNVFRVITDTAKDDPGAEYAANLEECATELAKLFSGFIASKGS